MQIFHSIDEIPTNFRPSVVTIGNFDGVHRGHQAVIAEVIARARDLNAYSVAVTFDPHPIRILRPEVPLRLITLLDQKLGLLAQTGVGYVLVLPFTNTLSRLTAREFAHKILAEALGAVEVHEGENFRFGAGARAGVNELAILGEELRFQVRVHPPTTRRGTVVSSSAVRAAIADGNMRAARQLLGRPFEIFARPAAGRGYGSRYTVPTINLAPYKELLPANGVYITCLEVNGEIFPSVTNAGNRPTFGKESFAVESHILDFHPISLDETTHLQLRFLDRIRDEIEWPSPEALKEQIARDVARARHYFGLHEAVAGEPSSQTEIPES
ncbi:MAG TPA: riboflavin biosynthesis protein RibF [Acidobacteriaceae bacterium]|nr:riboflavin biosynthesis protein RibF [Acidobacteriaceae bacterium]